MIIIFFSKHSISTRFTMNHSRFCTLLNSVFETHILVIIESTFKIKISLDPANHLHSPCSQQQ